MKPIIKKSMIYAGIIPILVAAVVTASTEAAITTAASSSRE